MSMQDPNLMQFAICDYILSCQWHEMLRENIDHFEWSRVFRENLFHIAGSQNSLKMPSLTLLLALHLLLDQHHNEIRRQRAQWWHSDTLSALLSLCEGNPPVNGGFPTQKHSDAESWCFFVVSPNLLLNKDPIGLWFETSLYCCTSSCLVCAWVDIWRIYTYCRITLDI